MQTFTSQPLAQQSKENPFSNPTLLASLIIPHIDTYLRGNDNVRFLLIEYPVEHLSTMLAMQKLLGSQVMKVVGISKEADTTMFSMADYRLSSVAAEAEVAECVEAIRDTLASISDFYKPPNASQQEKEAPAKPLSTKSSNLTSSSIPPLLPPPQHSPRHKPTAVVIPTFTAITTPPPPLLPASLVDAYNRTHHYVHSNGENHGHGHIHTYLPTAAFSQPNRSISPPPCSHSSSTLSSSITRSSTLISHGTVPVATPSVIPPTSTHSITRERSQRPSISGPDGGRPMQTPASPSGSSTISPRTKIPSTFSTATTCVQQGQILSPRIVPVITTTNPTSPRTATGRLQSPLSLSSGPLSSGASTASLVSTGTDFHTDVDDPHSHSDNHSHSHLDSDSQAEDDDHDDDEEEAQEEEEDDDPFDFFEIDFEERRLMPMFLKEQIEAHIAAAGSTGEANGLGAVMPLGHVRSPGVGNGRDVVDLEALLGGGRKDFGERFFGRYVLLY